MQLTSKWRGSHLAVQAVLAFPRLLVLALPGLQLVAQYWQLRKIQQTPQHLPLATISRPRKRLKLRQAAKKKPPWLAVLALGNLALGCSYCYSKTFFSPIKNPPKRVGLGQEGELVVLAALAVTFVV